MYREDYLIFIKRLGIALILFPISRAIFLFFNYDYFNANLSDLILPFLYGVRFDLSSVLITNIVFILLSLIPFRSKVYDKLIKFVFIVSNIFAFSINIGDTEFFKFNGKRITADFLGLGEDISNQVLQLVTYYWYLSIIVIIAFVFMYFFYPNKKHSEVNGKKLNIFWSVGLNSLLIVIVFVGIRGGLQMRSISPKQAFIFSDYKFGNLSINSFYTFVRSLDKESLPNVGYFKTDKLAIKVLKQINTRSQNFLNPKSSNVVIIIVESLSQEYVDGGFTPFFSDLKEKGFYGDLNFANGRRSIEALPSILVGVPSLIGKPISQSQYQTNRYIGLPKILKENGYEVSFFHGGKTGTMDFDAYTRSIGINRYFGMEDYPDQSHFDGHWGIYDHHFLEFFSTFLESQKTKFFSTIFTLSSHQPYSIPKEFKNKFPVGNLEIHESIGYVDNALKSFFEKNKNKNWFKNTLFVITADHTQKLNTKKYKNDLGKYRVPLLFFHPSVDLSSFNNDKVTQHADILPSVLDFLGVKRSERLLFGRSVFSKNTGRSINYINGKYLYYTDQYNIRLNHGKATFYSRENKKITNEKAKAFSRGLVELKAFIQYMNNGMLKNGLYIED